MGGVRRRGIFITIEGVDGAGKSTHIRRLARYLAHNGRRVRVTREPGGTWMGEQVRKLLVRSHSRPLTPMAELALMYGARAEHLAEVVLPALRQGEIVLSDRFSDASFAYQGWGRRLGAETVAALDRVVCRGLKPDLTILLDLDPRTGLERAAGRKRRRAPIETRFEAEGLAFQCRVRAGYHAIARRDPKRVRIIRTDRPPAEVQLELRSIVDQLLAQRYATDRGKKEAKVRPQRLRGRPHRRRARTANTTDGL